jgi:hypothetical protein
MGKYRVILTYRVDINQLYLLNKVSPEDMPRRLFNLEDMRERLVATIWVGQEN